MSDKQRIMCGDSSVKRWLRWSGVGLVLVVGFVAGVNVLWPPAVTMIAALGPTVATTVSGQINHQGVVAVNGVRFSGTGLFRFAIVDPDANQNRWTNDNTQIGNAGSPTSGVNLPVTNGIYGVRLGDTGLANMTAIPSVVFEDDNLVLRIWFDDGVNGLHQLSPDHTLTTAPYAFVAASAVKAASADTAPGVVPIGAIVAWHKNLAGVPALPPGSAWLECNGQTIDDPASPMRGQATPNLNAASGYAGGRFLRGGATSGEMQPATGITDNLGVYWPSGNVANNDGSFTSGTSSAYGFANSSGPFGYTFTFEQVRPVNMSVVWIMRIK